MNTRKTTGTPIWIIFITWLSKGGTSKSPVKKFFNNEKVNLKKKLQKESELIMCYDFIVKMFERHKLQMRIIQYS